MSCKTGYKDYKSLHSDYPYSRVLCIATVYYG